MRTIETLEGAAFSKADFEQFDPDNCKAYFFSDRQVALLFSCLRYAEWSARWEDRDMDAGLVFDTGDVLMSNCDISIQLTRIANALYVEPDPTQVQVVVDAGIEDSVSIASVLGGEQVDYTEVISEVATVLGYVAAVA